MNIHLEVLLNVYVLRSCHALKDLLGVFEEVQNTQSDIQEFENQIALIHNEGMQNKIQKNNFHFFKK